MINALHHISVGTANLVEAAQLTERLLGHLGIISHNKAIFRLNNVSYVISTNVSDITGLTGLGFEIASADDALRICERRGLKIARPIEHTFDGVRTIDIDPQSTFGASIQLLERTEQSTRNPRDTAINSAAVAGLDHVVIRTPNPERATALYGARLGLDLRLDRSEPKWGTRFMFFRCGDTIIEIVHNLNEQPSSEPDQLWGLTWRVVRADAAHERLKNEGFDLSEIRPGRKPGTRVFTVRNKTLGVPTLILESIVAAKGPQKPV